ncbi:MAG: hypothetical protein ACOH5I_26280 [Oligoflexus sp.]
MYSRFHIYVKKGRGKRRTTLSLETILADLLAIKLGHDPDTREGHSAVRAWLQEMQDEQATSDLQTTLIKKYVILEITQKRLVDKYLSE